MRHLSARPGQWFGCWLRVKNSVSIGKINWKSWIQNGHARTIECVDDKLYKYTYENSAAGCRPRTSRNAISFDVSHKHCIIELLLTSSSSDRTSSISTSLRPLFDAVRYDSAWHVNVLPWYFSTRSNRLLMTSVNQSRMRRHDNDIIISKCIHAKQTDVTTADYCDTCTK